MMMLSRRVGESIQINDNVKVTITETRGNTVRVAIDAPREVAVRRVRNEGTNINGSQETKQECKYA